MFLLIIAGFGVGRLGNTLRGLAIDGALRELRASLVSSSVSNVIMVLRRDDGNIVLVVVASLSAARLDMPVLALLCCVEALCCVSSYETFISLFALDARPLLSKRKRAFGSLKASQTLEIALWTSTQRKTY